MWTWGQFPPETYNLNCCCMRFRHFVPEKIFGYIFTSGIDNLSLTRYQIKSYSKSSQKISNRELLLKSRRLKMFNLKIGLFCIIIQVIALSAQQRLPDDEVINFIKSKGYEGEAYQVITEDGYIIRLHHLHPRINTYGYKLPVFLMHSAFSNPLYFLNSGQNSSLGLFLSDNGYDVYLGNVRGSKFATAHKWLSINSDDYWRFDFHEMGVYDLPPMIDLALQLSCATKIFYVGHSQSCPQALALLSLRPEYNNKIAQSHLFAPVANMMHIRPSAKAMVPIFLVSDEIFFEVFLKTCIIF